MKTTIQINQETLERLKTLRQYPKETYEEILNSLMDEYEEEDVLTDEDIKDIKIALEEVKKGKVYPIEQIAKEMRISLK